MTDRERLKAAREFVSKATKDMVLSVQEYEGAVRKAAEALPPFTRIKTAS